MGRILIADVEKNHGFLLKQELEDEGHSVDLILRVDTTFPPIAGKLAYDIVILDMQMPGLNYYERLKRIKGHVAVAHVVVFVDSAASDERRSLLLSGADACFAKHEIDNLKKDLRQYGVRAHDAAGTPVPGEGAERCCPT
jgi:DNA-binding response OmpR family regulator